MGALLWLVVLAGGGILVYELFNQYVDKKSKAFENKFNSDPTYRQQVYNTVKDIGAQLNANKSSSKFTRISYT